MGQPTNATEASKAAKTLVGSFAHLKPDNAKTFIEAVAAVLAQYPLGIVEECCDPRRGLARTVEFLTIKSLVEWCDVRLAFHRGLASYVAPKRCHVEPELTDDQRGRRIAAYRGLLMTVVKNPNEARKLTIREAAKIGRPEEAPARMLGKM